MKSAKCFFTGHRILSNEDKERLQKILIKYIEQLESEGIYEFYTGGALGFDYVAAMAVAEVKNKKPYICLKLCLPCYGSEKRWSSKEKFNFQMLKTKCDSFEYMSKEEYYDGCMQKRNEDMAKMCGTCIAFCKRDKSGTKKTIDFAESNGCRVINLAEEF